MTPISDSDDSIDVHIDKDGRLWLTCGSEAFAQVRDAILGVVSLDPAISRDEICHIEVEEIPLQKRQSRTVLGWLAMIGCALFGMGLLAVFSVGAVTIVRSVVGN